MLSWLVDLCSIFTVLVKKPCRVRRGIPCWFVGVLAHFCNLRSFSNLIAPLLQLCVFVCAFAAFADAFDSALQMCDLMPHFHMCTLLTWQWFWCPVSLCGPAAFWDISIWTWNVCGLDFNFPGHFNHKSNSTLVDGFSCFSFHIPPKTNHKSVCLKSFNSFVRGELDQALTSSV